MNSTVSALRAISAITMRRILVPILWIAGGVLTVLYIGTIYLFTEIDPWWALLLIVLIPITIIITLLGIGLWFVSGKLLPRNYDAKHKKSITSFTDKILGLVENSKTPYPIHLFLIGKDIIRGKESRHLKGMIDDSSSLKRDFDAIKRSFE